MKVNKGYIVAVECAYLIAAAAKRASRWGLTTGEMLEEALVALMLRLNGASKETIRVHSDGLYYCVWYEQCGSETDYTAEETIAAGEKEAAELYEDITTLSVEVQVTIADHLNVRTGLTYEIDHIEVDAADNTLYVIYFPTDRIDPSAY